MKLKLEKGNKVKLGSKSFVLTDLDDYSLRKDSFEALKIGNIDLDDMVIRRMSTHCENAKLLDLKYIDSA